ncbi:hypothetical protein FDT80_14680 [Sulfitobacter sabulilitoris]|uniref:Haem-binding uptake Tiki superfamily ChaN domain-containing protein n=2 Tax=Sulfitobacter sabulilitoris TaxID=2562655 RepID=A0A5S3PDT0_9RHOB|nr:hypothetical protein FDT80_14680 [Sulfitobacter sabulilitoris]
MTVRTGFRGVAVLAAPFLCAGTLWAQEIPQAARDADVVVLGEAHDNPAHHATQARWVAALRPAALVFEMLTPDQAVRVTPAVRTDPGALADALEWDASGWPDFAMYYPIFAAAPDAVVLGAGLPRDTMQTVMTDGADALPDAARFGLNSALPKDQQAAREDLQAEAHCGALPETMLPGMVKVQRARDAALARAALDAIAQTGGPVAVIAGNGHARRDWGVPHLLAQAEDKITVFALGQAEDGRAPEGGFDLVVNADAVERGDPCAAFR